MEKLYKGFTVRDDGTVINRFGKKVGFKGKNGTYMYIHVEGHHVLMHRFIWEAFFGEIEDGMQIDHIDTNRFNNALSNMRLVTDKQNKNNPLTIEHFKVSNKEKGKKKNI